MRKLRFLLIEDNHELGRALCQRFALEGHVVDHVEMLEDAATAIETVVYDLILHSYNRIIRLNG